MKPFFLKNSITKTAALLFVMLCVLLLPLSAKITLPRLVSDRMVLQRDTELKIWGWADDGETVTVRFRGKHYAARPDNDKRWEVTLPPQNAGGPFVLEVNEIVIRDVLVGDVWLCGGQSNQETPISRLVDIFPEINVSNNHMIRHYKVPTQESDERQEAIADGAQWVSGTASDVMKWTALAYFFAQEAYNKTFIPQGMLVSSKGGSAIESWISTEHLKVFPEIKRAQDLREAQKEATTDKGAGKWQADFDDSNWQTANVPGRWRDSGITARGVVWYRKTFEIPASMAGKHAKLYLGTLVDSDSAFVNGRFVGATSYTYPPRKYDIPGGILRTGKNTVTVQLTSAFGNGEFVTDKPYKIVSDDSTIDLTGQWHYRVGKDMGSAPTNRREGPTEITVAGSELYNGMIYPIRDYKVRAAIWYQGESNAGRPQEYEALLKALIANWREDWKAPQMPFLLVQLPNFMTKSQQPSESGWAAIREAQLKVAETVPHTALTVTYDVGEWNDIHPLNKKTVAQRLFLAARKVVYNEKIVSSGPMYDDMKIEGDKIVLRFTNIGGGLTSKSGALKHFAIAGADRKFVWATAEIKGNTVVVSCAVVKNPVAVRYAWSNNPEEANLRNKEGLLASPFRTDNW